MNDTDPRRHTRKPRCLPGAVAHRRRAAGVALMLLSLLAALKAHAADEGLQLRRGDAWQDAVALETDVDFRIRGLLAEVTVTQRFRNDSGDWLEGRYLLPLPENAAVGRLRIRIGDRLVEGEIREKAEAKAIYQAAAAQGRRAGLVEQSRPNLFRTAVANIGPGEAVEVEIGYWQPVDYRDGDFSLTLPLTLTPRYAPASSVEIEPGPMPAVCAEDCAEIERVPRVRSAQALPDALPPTVSLRADLDAGVPLAEVGSPTHAVSASANGRGWRIELADLVEASDRDFELRWRPRPSTQPRSAVFTETRDGEHYALVMVLPPTVQAERLPRELVLVIDHSGSMHGESMAQAIAALDLALSRLGPEDRFNVVRFNHAAGRLFPESVPATPENVDRARHHVAALRADGGTEMAAAVELALAGRPVPGYLRQVVLATDAAIGDEQALFAQIETQLGEARLFPVGIGSAPNGHFLRKAAELGRGSWVLVRDIGEVAARMDTLFARLDRPALRDLELHWPTLAEVYPERTPDLYHGEPLQLVARLPALHGELRVEGAARHQPWVERVPLQAGIDSPGVGRLWGRARLDALDDALRRGANADEVRAASLEVALAHGLVSRYTSLVAVERTPSRPHDAQLASTQFANATPAGSLAYSQGGTASRTLLGLALALGLLAAALLRPRA